MYMIRKCRISGNDFMSNNGEVVSDMYLTAYKLGFEEGKKSVELTSETINTDENTQTENTEM